MSDVRVAIAVLRSPLRALCRASSDRGDRYPAPRRVLRRIGGDLVAPSEMGEHAGLVGEHVCERRLRTDER